MLAAKGTDAPGRRAALEELARAYWYPLYAFARRRGLDAEVAADRTQGFFALLLARGDVARADRTRGRFRAYLRSAFEHYLSDERERDGAQKRGGGHAIVSIDALDAEARLRHEPIDHDTPAKAFERAWVAELVARALERLRTELEGIGRGALFARLRPSLAGEDDAPPFAEVARELAMTENAVKVAAHRLRKRFAELVRDEVASTVDDPDDVEGELAALLRDSGRDA